MEYYVFRILYFVFRIIRISYSVTLVISYLATRTQDGHDLHGRKAGLSGSLGVKWGLAHQAVCSLLASQQAIRIAPVHTHLH